MVKYIKDMKLRVKKSKLSLCPFKDVLLRRIRLKKTTFITKNGYKYIVIAVPTKLFFSTAYKNNNGYKNKRLGNKRFLEHPRGSSKCYMYKSTTAYKNIPGVTRIFILQKIFINRIKMTQFEKQDKVMKENFLPDRMELVSSKKKWPGQKKSKFLR